MVVKSKNRPITKGRIVNSIKVVDRGIRKAHSIRKFQDSYYVGIAYVGLMQLEKGVDESGVTCWRGNAIVENPISDIEVYITIYNKIVNRTENYVKQKYHQTEEGYYRNSDDWEDRTHYSPEDIEMWRDNMDGISESFFKFDMYYYADETTGRKGRLEKIFSYKTDYDYYSIEDVLDAISRKSEDAWGEVNIYLNDNAQTYQNIRDTEKLYPQTLSVSLPTGETLTLKMGGGDYYSSSMGNWHGAKSFVQDKIYADVDVYIRAVTSNAEGEFSDSDYYFERYKDSYSVNRDDSFEYYAVDVKGTITDGNTQVNAERSGYERKESWDRNFTGQGSQTLEGAIAIAESNIAEVYQEWTEFVDSVRNYVKVGHGQGYRRTVENTEPWDYNFGDTREDINYDEWQSYDQQIDAPISLPGTEWDPSGGYYRDDQDAEVFMTEYLGDNYRRALDYRYEDGENKLYFNESNWSVGVDQRNRLKQERSQEYLERVANYMGLKLVDYTDPLNFVLSKGVRKGVRKSKSIKRPYYDVEVKALKKSAKPKSFNSMVKSIRRKNNKNKKVM